MVSVISKDPPVRKVPVRSMGHGQEFFSYAGNLSGFVIHLAAWIKFTDHFSQAVAALYEKPELQVEAVHLSIALSYHGLLRVTPRVEATDAAICNNCSIYVSFCQVNTISSEYPV